MKKYASKTLLVIAGPTAVGKTAVAISLAKKLGTSIISADSRQCYRELTIGTAKPGQEELKAVHHYFIDAFPASEAVTAADFERLALGYLEEIFSKSDIAIACGGTGLYLKALTEGLDDMPPVDPAIVSELDAQFGEAGLLWLQEQVRTEDPLFFEQAETGNPARLLRALAFVRSTGKSITTYRTGTRKDRDFRIIKIALELPRDLLYKRINRRVDDMMKAGLVEEVTALYPLRHEKTLQTVGYAELLAYLDGIYTLEKAVDKIKQHTRNYAKRQLTWFRKDPEYSWINASSARVEEQILSKI